MKFKPLLKFQTKRFRMRPLEYSDYFAWRAAYENMQPKQGEFDTEPKKKKDLTREAFKKEIRKYEKRIKTNAIYMMAIFEKKTGRYMGMVYVSLILRFNVQSARIAYFIFNNYWKHGYGQEAVNACIDFSFKKLKLHRLEAEIQPHNRASIALAKSLGLQYEGLRKRAVYFNHKWHDHVIYSITAEDRGIKNTKPRIFG